MKTITKDEFIEVAKDLDNFYTGSDVALFAYARDCGCVDEVFSFMCVGNKTVGQVTKFIYRFTGQQENCLSA